MIKDVITFSVAPNWEHPFASRKYDTAVILLELPKIFFE